MKPDRLWYRTRAGKKWHLLANPSFAVDTLCGLVLRHEGSTLKESQINRADLCETCRRMATC